MAQKFEFEQLDQEFHKNWSGKKDRTLEKTETYSG